MPRLARPVVVRMLKTSLYAIIVSLTSEISARVDDYVRYGTSPFSNSRFDHLVMTDVDGIRGRPGARFEKGRMNNLGLQGRDVAIVNPKNHFRIVTLGASETFGPYDGPGHDEPKRREGVPV